MLAITEAPIPAQLLGIGTHGAGDPLPYPVALQRWESDGGAQPTTASEFRTTSRSTRAASPTGPAEHASVRSKPV